MELQFYKYQGTGNDFVLIDNRDGDVSLTTEQINFLCDRRFGIGADGLMLLEQKEGYDFHMVYFNSDGNESTMCGNGGRSIVAFARDIGVIENKAYFLAIDGPHDANVLGDGTVSLKMQDVSAVEEGNDFYFIDTGSPHHVSFVNDIQNFDVFNSGKSIRNSERFKAEGTNVNFVEKQNNCVFVRTYERGVEDETYSCGTGVTAAVLAAHLKGELTEDDQSKVKTLGGDLNVKFNQTSETTFNNIWLEGPAKFVFKGTITI